MNISAIYGAEDKEHAIKCTIIDSKTLTDGTPVYIAKCDGGTIQATPDMFHYLYTIIIQDEDGHDHSRAGYYKTQVEARKANNVIGYKGIEFSQVIETLTNSRGEVVALVQHKSGRVSGVLEGTACRSWSDLETAKAALNNAGFM